MGKKGDGELIASGSLFSIVLVALLIVITFMTIKANGEDYPSEKCIIIVSGSEGYSGNELGKASSFRGHFLETNDPSNIIYLTSPSDPNTDGPATMSNVEGAFEWLGENVLLTDDVVIYVSDHAKNILDQPYLELDDGNLSVGTVDSWLDDLDCLSITVIVNGERSGLAGPGLSGASRDIICSMGSTEEYDPDIFNMTRSLDDETADLNDDDLVDYLEAYIKEIEWLQGSGQDPVFYGPQ